MWICICKSRLQLQISWGLWVAVLVTGTQWCESEGRYGFSKLFGGWNMKYLRTVRKYSKRGKVKVSMLTKIRRMININKSRRVLGTFSRKYEK